MKLNLDLFQMNTALHSANVAHKIHVSEVLNVLVVDKFFEVLLKNFYGA